MPYHKQKNIERDFIDFTNAEQYYLQALSIPFYPGLTDDEVECVANQIIMELNVNG